MERIIALYLLSGLIKPTLMLVGINLPFDYVYICLIIIIIFIIKKIPNAFSKEAIFDRSYGRVVTIFIIFNLFAIITGAYSLSSEYFLVKVIYLIQNLLVMFLTFVINRESLIKVFKNIIYIILVCGVLFILFYNKQYQNYALGDISKEDSGLELYLTLGLMAGLGFLVCYYLNNSIKHRKKLLFALALILLISSARGPIVFTFLFLFFYFIIQKKLKTIFKVGLFAFLLIFLVFEFFPENVYVSRFESRFSMFLNSAPSESQAFNVRENLFSEAKNMISNKPILGYGLGSFGIYSTGKDIRSYPHNFIYELFSELGIIGLGVFMFFLIMACIYLVKRKEYLLVIIICYLLFNFLKGHSIIEVKFFYFTLFAFLSIAATNKKLNGYC
ncbi:O-antigen ligase family protein [Myroides odoratimimus]|uniref:O-antigen ligase family protein n=1 Tax=Myroides odoratimimus TaxID=76832 RepID=UPI002575C7F8|nr:O-antigen ligase family protein [Myroides odoratimimus]MDM1412156.1 O-antigen ligase family protein [Myroides odoratimimus]